jgi:short-subunit dehydrogenase
MSSNGHHPAPAGRVAVVTGASSGLGQATARRLAREDFGAVILVARREERLRALAEELGGHVSYVAVDLVEPDAPQRIADALHERTGGRLHLLVNNAGIGGRGTFAEAGWAVVQRTMELNFNAQVRLVEGLLPLLRASAPSAIVNVSSTAGRVARAGSGAYSASKAALSAWSDSLYLEERPHGVHVGVVLPGFIPTEGFPQQELVEHPLARFVLGRPEQAAAAILAAAKAPERYVPRFYALAAASRVLLPGLTRRVLGGNSAAALSTRTVSDQAAAEPHPPA